MWTVVDELRLTRNVWVWGSISPGSSQVKENFRELVRARKGLLLTGFTGGRRS